MKHSVHFDPVVLCGLLVQHGPSDNVHAVDARYSCQSIVSSPLPTQDAAGDDANECRFESQTRGDDAQPGDTEEQHRLPPVSVTQPSSWQTE